MPDQTPDVQTACELLHSPPYKARNLSEMFDRFLEISFLASGCNHDAIEYAALTRDIPEEIRRLRAMSETRPGLDSKP